MRRCTFFVCSVSWFSLALFTYSFIGATALITRGDVLRRSLKTPAEAIVPRPCRSNTACRSQPGDGAPSSPQRGESKDDLSLAVEDRLFDIARRLKLEVQDFDEGIYGYDSQDHRFGLEVLHTTIPFTATKNKDGSLEGCCLGVELREMAGASDGRGLVLVSAVFGAAASVSPKLQVGDALTGVSVEGTPFRERLIGLNYEGTCEAIARAKEAACELAARNGATTTGPVRVSFEADRLVKRAPVTVEVVEPGGNVLSIDALAGENLRRLLQRKQVQIYNPRTKRFDMPFETGNCAGDGLCGTCLVHVDEGMDLLSPRDSFEELITRGRPSSWRTSCRAVVGYENRPGTIRIHTRPQDEFEDEIDRGVPSVRAG
jgi:2Fe-2S iron-sulfur cluster binding domain